MQMDSNKKKDNYLKLDFKNLGPIEKGELELKNFNLVCGLNNSGKTYLAYLLFGVLSQRWGLRKDFFDLETLGEFEEEEQEWEESRSIRISEEKILKLFREFISSIDIEIDMNRVNDIDYTDSFAYSDDAIFLADILNCSAELFPDFSYKLNPDRDTLVTDDLETQFRDWLTNPEYIPQIPELELKWLNKEFVIKGHGSWRDKESLPFEFFGRLLFWYFQSVLCQVWPRPYLFSTERSSISLFLKELDSNRNLLVDALQRLDDPGKLTEESFEQMREKGAYRQFTIF